MQIDYIQVSLAHLTFVTHSLHLYNYGIPSILARIRAPDVSSILGTNPHEKIDKHGVIESIQKVD